MFTGLIREIAEVKSFSGGKLSLRSGYTPKIGDSVAVNGACLTVIDVTKDGFSVELSDETISHIAIDRLKGEVHIEPAMQMGDRFEGHIVQGHIDLIGTIQGIQKSGSSFDLYIEIPESSSHLMVQKGSITIDGVSLTINSVENSLVRLTIIPHTMENTIFKHYTTGTRINIESDLFARYIDQILTAKESRKAGLSWSEVDSIMTNY